MGLNGQKAHFTSLNASSAASGSSAIHALAKCHKVSGVPAAQHGQARGGYLGVPEHQWSNVVLIPTSAMRLNV